MRILIAAMFMAGAVGAGWAQEGERGKDAPKPKAQEGEKDAPKPKVQEGEKDAPKPRAEGGAGGAGFLTLDQVDTNGDGKVTRAELEAAIKKLAPARVRDGERKAEGAGEKKPDRRADGEGDKKEGEKKAPEKKEGEK